MFHINVTFRHAKMAGVNPIPFLSLFSYAHNQSRLKRQVASSNLYMDPIRIIYANLLHNLRHAGRWHRCNFGRTSSVMVQGWDERHMLLQNDAYRTLADLCRMWAPLHVEPSYRDLRPPHLEHSESIVWSGWMILWAPPLGLLKTKNQLKRLLMNLNHHPKCQVQDPLQSPLLFASGSRLRNWTSSIWVVAMFCKTTLSPLVVQQVGIGNPGVVPSLVWIPFWSHQARFFGVSLDEIHHLCYKFWNLSSHAGVLEQDAYPRIRHSPELPMQARAFHGVHCEVYFYNASWCFRRPRALNEASECAQSFGIGHGGNDGILDRKEKKINRRDHSGTKSHLVSWNTWIPMYFGLLTTIHCSVVLTPDPCVMFWCDHKHHGGSSRQRQKMERKSLRICKPQATIHTRKNRPKEGYFSGGCLSKCMMIQRLNGAVSCWSLVYVATTNALMTWWYINGSNMVTMAIFDSLVPRLPDAPGSLDLLKELVWRMSAIWTMLMVSMRYPKEDSNL